MMETFKRTMVDFSLVKHKTDIPSFKVKGSQCVNEFAHKYIYGDDIEVYESIWMLTLNRANNVTGYIKLSQGTTSSSIVDIKILSTIAVQSLASSIILIHNHPSDNINPSTNDINMTERTDKAMKLFDITLLDHIIVTPSKKYYAFADNGKL